jgi:site-specific DNA-methyltransferase (adenine-specific)
MADKSGFSLQSRNPDILTSIANLSNDEVFTPPAFANQMLDTVAEAWAQANDGANIWADSTVSFLDPFTKSGVFLREITRRLSDGLEKDFPDTQKRIDHILTQQVFGVAITELTSLLARRSVYCSKWANGKHSIATEFTKPEGNIWFERTEHTWAGGKERIVTVDDEGKEMETTVDGRCKFCNAKQKEYARGATAESHAYSLIHTNELTQWVKNTFGGDVQFDVIIGNPPYQLSDGGGEGSSASPLYHRFVEQARGLEPRLLTMVIPARWYSGGKGLDEFRKMMLDHGGLLELHDFPETDLVFPGVTIRGGVCYFLASKAETTETKIVNYKKNGAPDIAVRSLRLGSTGVFVRYNKAISIVSKVLEKNETMFDARVQSRNHFGIPSNFPKFSRDQNSVHSVTLFRSRRGSTDDKRVFIAKEDIAANIASKDRLKVLVSKASPGGDDYPHAVFSEPIIGSKNTVCTETYLIVDFPASEGEARNLIGYMKTRFFRFLVAQIKATQNISKGSFALVPVQDFSQSWTDKELYGKYNLTEDEIAFIESMIRPMESTSE